MASFVYKIVDICEKCEENFRYDVEANGHFYLISYCKDMKLRIDVVNHYTFYDECNELTSKDNLEKIDEFDCDLKTFCNTCFNIYESKIEGAKYDYWGYGEIIKKIKINRDLGL